jgi:short-subunit dehydrogenase
VQTNISLHALTATGQAHGKMDDGQNNGISAEECARQLIRAVECKKREILIGKKELWMVHIKKWLPFLFYRIVNKIKHT